MCVHPILLCLRAPPRAPTHPPPLANTLYIKREVFFAPLRLPSRIKTVFPWLSVDIALLPPQVEFKIYIIF